MTRLHTEQKRLLEEAIKSLRTKKIQSVWHNGEWEKGDSSEDIVHEISEWLHTIWKIMWEDVKGRTFDLIRRWLYLCSHTVNRLRNMPGRSRIDGIYVPITIQSAKFGVVYSQEDATIDGPLDWMWRELLVLSQTRRQPTQIVIDDINDLGIMSDVLYFIRSDDEYGCMCADCDEFDDTHWDSREVECICSDCDGFYDKHWDDDIRNAASTIRLRVEEGVF
ncbi:hypothetical protein BDZ89DRAFT_1065880 [Hymenopellis radicata]|nr:hypothetical protein BDZ89DRAFT_1065880 [Hymenopellis radicata]